MSEKGLTDGSFDRRIVGVFRLLINDFGVRGFGVNVYDPGDEAQVRYLRLDESKEMPGVHRIAALLKRWLLGVHHGAVNAKHLDYYLDEYTFRFDRRTSRSRGMLFYRLMQQAVATASTSYRQLVDGHHQM